MRKRQNVFGSFSDRFGFLFVGDVRAKRGEREVSSGIPKQGSDLMKLAPRDSDSVDPTFHRGLARGVRKGWISLQPYVLRGWQPRNWIKIGRVCES